MKLFRLQALLAIASLALSVPSSAQAAPKISPNPERMNTADMTAMCFDDGAGNCVTVSLTNPMPITGGGGGGGGGGDASAANQTILNSRIGDITTPATGSTNARLGLILSKQPALGTAGTASADVLSVQGIANGVAIDTVVKSSATDRGAVIGTTATQLMASNTARRGFSVQVQSASASCYISGSATATADYHSLQIAAGTYFESSNTHVGTGAISIICSAASTSVYAREW